MRFHRILCLLLCLLLTAGVLTGCGSGGASFTWRVDHVPANLDPQIAQESPERIAVTNLYRGLTRIDENGEAVLDCAESYTVSDDGLTYTFTLKDGLAYTKLKKHEKEYPLTAADFVFGMERVFRDETSSPYRDLYSNLKGADGSGALGVSAPDERTVVYQLSSPDPAFLEKLAQPGAMPCNEEFFEHSAGAYGLNAATTLANGYFYLYNWNENGLFLRRSASSSLITSLRIVLDTTTQATPTPQPASGTSVAQEQIPATGAAAVATGDVTAAIDEASAAGSLPSIPYTATTWALVFNCKDEQLAPQSVRLALGASAAGIEQLPTGFSAADGLIPPAIQVNGSGYRDAVGSQMPTVSDVKELCRTGLSEAGLQQFSGIQVLYPEGSTYQTLIEQVSQQWQKELGAFSAYFTLKAMPLDELKSTVVSGDYQIALLPFSPSSADSAAFLQQFTGGALTGWQSASFDSQVSQLSGQLDISAEQIAQAEQTLLAGGAISPLWYQDQALVMAQGVDHVVFDPFGPVLDLTWATYTGS